MPNDDLLSPEDRLIRLGLFSLDNQNYWRDRLHVMIRHLLGIADHVLAEPAPPDTGVITIHNSARSLVEGGREDIIDTGALHTLGRGLAHLPERDREQVYSAIFHLMHGAWNIAGYGITPAGMLDLALVKAEVIAETAAALAIVEATTAAGKEQDHARMAVLRTEKAMKLNPRRNAQLAAFKAASAEVGPGNPKAMLDNANKRLDEDNQISRTKFYKWLKEKLH